MKKDIGAPGKDESEIIFNSIVKIVEDIKMYKIQEQGIEEAVIEALFPYILSSYKPIRKSNIFVWDGKFVGSTNSTTQQKLDWDKIQIDIISVSLVFKRK